MVKNDAKCLRETNNSGWSRSEGMVKEMKKKNKKMVSVDSIHVRKISLFLLGFLFVAMLILYLMHKAQNTYFILLHHNTFSILWIFVVYFSILKYLVRLPNIFKMIQIQGCGKVKRVLYLFLFSPSVLCVLYVLWVCAMLYTVCSCSLISRFMIFELVKFVYDVGHCYGNRKQWQTTIPVGLFPRDQSIIHYHCILYTLYLHHSQFTLRNFISLASVCLFVCLLVYFLQIPQPHTLESNANFVYWMIKASLVNRESVIRWKCKQVSIHQHSKFKIYP